MKKLLFIALLVCIKQVNAQVSIITTVAGDTIPGYSGDGNAAILAELNHPYGVAADTIGNIYIADSYNNVIRKVNSAGIISTIAGNHVAGYSGDGGLATLAQLNYPVGVAIDAEGNVYVADTYNSVIRKITTSGVITTFAGNHTSGNTGDGGQASLAQLNSPQGVAVDKAGNIYIADSYNQVIRKVNSAGTINVFAGNYSGGFSGDGGLATSAQLSTTYGVAVDIYNNVYIALGPGSGRVRKVNSSGIISTFAGKDTLGSSGDGGIATSAELFEPVGVAADILGNVYIADYGANLIRKVNTSGIIITLAGNGVGSQGGGGFYSGDGGPATAAEIALPMGVAADIFGNVYIADDGNNAIRKVTNAATAGISQISGLNTQISIYPNPNNGSFIIEPSNVTKQTMQVYDVNGKLVLSQTINGKTSIDAGSLNEGVYNISLQNDEGVVNKRLVIVR